jgi:hypothetical protein
VVRSLFKILNSLTAEEKGFAVIEMQGLDAYYSSYVNPELLRSQYSTATHPCTGVSLLPIGTSAPLSSSSDEYTAILEEDYSSVLLEFLPLKLCVSLTPELSILLFFL